MTYAIRSLSRWINLLFAVFSTCFSPTLFLAETWAQPMKLTVSYTGVGPVNLPVVLAKQAGIFTRNGLDVTVVRAQAAVSTMALISGEVGFIQAAAPAEFDNVFYKPNDSLACMFIGFRKFPEIV